MAQTGLEPAIPAIEWPQPYVLDRKTTDVNSFTLVSKRPWRFLPVLKYKLAVLCVNHLGQGLLFALDHCQ